MNVSIVVLSKYPDLFASIKQQLDEFEPHIEKWLVRTGEAIPRPPSPWQMLQGGDPFNYSRNLNLGLTITWPNDVIVLGDDVRLTGPFVQKLREVAYSDPTIAFAVPELGGQSPFVFGYLKREVIEKVGYMDEDFDGYAYQDNNFCWRFEMAGYRTQPTKDVVAYHQGGTSYFRDERAGGESVQSQTDRMKKIYDQKRASVVETRTID